MDYVLQPQNVICVLGMHRSGTSALMGSLQLGFGVELGKFHEWNSHNQRGNRENQDIVDLHDSILAYNKGTWDCPPSHLKWSAEHLEKAKYILASYSRKSVWGFKDPRTILVIKQWRTIINNLNCLAIFRHPLAVAKSLNKRSKMPIEQGIALWTHYNTKLLEEVSEYRIPLLCFDWGNKTFGQKVNKAAKQLGLKQENSTELFYSTDLHHHRPNNFNKVPTEAIDLYNSLLTLSI